MIKNLLEKISELQIREDAENNKNGYVKGLFPSQRAHPYFKFKREDNSVFFTASTLFILNNVADLFTENEREIVKKITNLGTLNYHLYQNKKGLKTYNFWQTGSDNAHFPNSNFLHKFRYFKLPDDIDTTALVYLTKPHSQQDILWMKEKAAKHANLVKLQVKTTAPKYSNLHAYSSWFGEKMPIEFDVCVHSNFMFWVFKNKLPLNKNDQDTLKFIRSVIVNSEYFKTPFLISVNYPESSLILYHLTRFIAGFSIPGFDDLKSKLIKDIYHQLQRTSEQNIMEKIILNSSLMRFGLPSEFTINEKIINDNYYYKKIKKFEWFTAGFLTVYDNPLTMPLAKYKLFHMKFRLPYDAAHFQ